LSLSTHRKRSDTLLIPHAITRVIAAYSAAVPKGAPGSKKSNQGRFFSSDLTGNGCGDIIGFAEGEVYASVAINNGDGTFQPKKLALTSFGYNYGWRVRQNPRFLVDLTGDGRADILGFGNGEVYVSYNDGKGNFTEAKPLIKDFGCDEGWTAERTERYVANLFHS